MGYVSNTDAEPSTNEFESTILHSVHKVNEGQLNNLVSQSAGGTLFHRYEWLAAVEESFDREPRHTLMTKGGNPVGFLPNFVIDVPLPTDTGTKLAEALPLKVVEPPPPGYGGPILTGDPSVILDGLFDSALLTNGMSTLFHRIHTFDTDSVEYGRYLESLGYSLRLTRCLPVLDLRDDWETVLEGMDSTRRREIRRAVEQDYEVERHPLGEDLEATYERYVSNMERVDGTVLPRAFFERLSDRIPSRVRVFKATVDGEEVGRYVYLLDDESGILHHWLSAIGDSSNFEYHPSELLHRRGIRWGIERGYERYSFGPTNPHFSDSVFKFKSKYGASPLPSLRWERGTLPLVWHAYDAGRSWYRRSQVDTARSE